LNRGLAICLGLRDRGADARLVTNSPFAEGLARLARCPVIGLEGDDWSTAALDFLKTTQPAAVVTDTFPYGLRGELRDVNLPVPLVHVARRLQQPFAIDRRRFARIIQVEPLSPEHAETLRDRVVLEGPVLLAPGRIRTPVPPELDRDGLTLVVHSGPEEEVAELTALAGGECVVISPWSGVEYYPATNLYARAGRVITGAGYNSMADLLAWRTKHTAVPFARTYDDQFARVREFFRRPGDGTAQAVDAIRSVL
jgi:hypothetical protein